MNVSESFWRTGRGRFIRWFAFLPIGVVLSGLLHAIPLLAIEYARGYRPELNFFTIVMALFVVSILGTLICLWFLGTFFCLI